MHVIKSIFIQERFEVSISGLSINPREASKTSYI